MWGSFPVCTGTGWPERTTFIRLFPLKKIQRLYCHSQLVVRGVPWSGFKIRLSWDWESDIDSRFRGNDMERMTPNYFVHHS